MKRIGFYVTALLAGLWTSCSNVEDVVSPVENEGQFVAVMAEGESRTAINGSSVAWSNDDALSIFRKNGYNTKYELKSLTNETGIFKYTGDYTAPSDKFNETVTKNYAVYPYGDDVAIVANGEVSVTIPATQSYKTITTDTGDEIPTFDPAAAFMVAAAIDNQLAFKNANTLLKIELTQMPGDTGYTIEDIVLSSDSQMNGKATITIADNPTVTFDQVTQASSSATNNSLTLDCGNNGVSVVSLDKDEPEVFYLVVTPGNYTGLKLTLKGKYNTANYEKEFDLSSLNAITRNQLVTIQYVCGSDDFNGSIDNFDSTSGNVNVNN